MQIVLASTSPYRSQLLERLDVAFDTVAPRTDETPLPGEAVDELVRRLAREKALDVGERVSDALVIGSDQMAVHRGSPLGKPGTAANARAQLRELSGSQVQFLTALALVNTRDGTVEEALVTTPVQFRDLSTTQIARYVERESPLDCAGAFKSEGLGIGLFTVIGGGDPTALIGLPLIELCGMLGRQGYDVLSGEFGSS